MTAETEQTQTPPLNLLEKGVVKSLMYSGRTPLVYKASGLEGFKDIPDTDYVCFVPPVRTVELERIERSKDAKELLFYSPVGMFLGKVGGQILSAEDGELLIEMIEDVISDDMLSKVEPVY